MKTTFEFQVKKQNTSVNTKKAARGRLVFFGDCVLRVGVFLLILGCSCSRPDGPAGSGAYSGSF